MKGLTLCVCMHVYVYGKDLVVPSVTGFFAVVADVAVVVVVVVIGIVVVVMLVVALVVVAQTGRERLKMTTQAVLRRLSHTGEPQKGIDGMQTRTRSIRTGNYGYFDDVDGRTNKILRLGERTEWNRMTKPKASKSVDKRTARTTSRPLSLSLSLSLSLPTTQLRRNRVDVRVSIPIHISTYNCIDHGRHSNSSSSSTTTTKEPQRLF